MKYIFFLVLTTLALFGCNAPEKSQKNTLFCYVRFDEAINSVKAEATLQDIAQKKSVELPGGILYQGIPMTLMPALGMSYRYEDTAVFSPEDVFEWRDKENNKNLFRMSIDPIKKFSLLGKRISQALPTTLQWEGAALGKGETLVFMWENAEKGLTFPMEVSTTSSQPSIDIPAVKLKEIAPGNWTLYLVRKKMMKAMVGDMPVNGIIEYYTKAIMVEVTK